MFKQIWRQLVRWFRRLFGIGRSRKLTPPIRQKPLPPLSDADLESLFIQLLEGVHQQRGQAWAHNWLKNIEHRVTTERWVEWLRRFGNRLLASSTPNGELAARMVQLGELWIGEIGDVAYEVGTQLLRHNSEPIAAANQEGKKNGQEAEASTIDEAEAWFNQGVRQALAGDFEEAIATYDKALNINPNNDLAWFGRGVALEKLGQYEEALATYDKALNINPNNNLAWFGRGVALVNLGRVEEAIATYDKALDINPNNDLAWYNRGVALGKLGRIEEALASYDKALDINPNNDLAWLNWGNALGKLGRIEEALASFDKALDINSNNDLAWFERGFALGKLGRIEEEIASYDKALDINPNNDLAWYNRGVALGKLGRIEEALASYDKALDINPNNDLAWFERGVALGKLGRIEEALASYDKALNINPNNDLAWYNRGVAAGRSVSCDPLLALLSPIANQNPHLNQRGYEGKLASYEEGLKHCQQDTHPEGWGKLHQAIGNAHDFRGRDDSRPRGYWRKAVKSYNQALLSLTEADFPQLHLEVLQDLIGVLLNLGETVKADELRRRGTDLLQRLLKEPNFSENSKKQLALKFAGFEQLTVDLVLQSGNWCAALEIAEQGKNACLSWMLGAWSHEVLSPRWQEIKQLLSPTTAAIYWHLSPAALRAFILKHDAPSPILITTSTPTTREELPIATRRLRDFENWVKEWNRQYANYRKGKDKQVEAENNWRDRLPEMLQQLANILDIPAIAESIRNSNSKVQTLILIPHRDLHRFPLHALFPDELTTTYLPSAQIGIALLGKEARVEGSLLSVEHPNSEGYYLLHHAEIESAAITRLFHNPTPKRIAGEAATNAAVKEALKNEYSILHFSGHSIYNFQDPKQSALALNGTDYLTLAEIGNLDRLSSYQLINLSSCETAITGNQTITTEYVGLVSAFLYQSVDRVISTLWTVTDDASSFLMIYFYWQLKKGKSPAVALAKATKWLRSLTDAKLERIYRVIFAQLPPDEKPIRPFIRRKLQQISQMDSTEKQHKRFDHPYYWAAFIITGRHN
ncbi:prenyltransferase [Cyanosarcina cf. burmensis CCALA 770]|nr:prenyltransferase [Cyanosarcina cf. burmensis CCALA 770]